MLITSKLSLLLTNDVCHTIELSKYSVSKKKKKSQELHPMSGLSSKTTMENQVGKVEHNNI